MSLSKRRTAAGSHLHTARHELLAAARELDTEHPSAHRCVMSAISATDDAMEATAEYERSALRRWADDHGENADELAAEARGEI